MRGRCRAHDRKGTNRRDSHETERGHPTDVLGGWRQRRRRQLDGGDVDPQFAVEGGRRRAPVSPLRARVRSPGVVLGEAAFVAVRAATTRERIHAALEARAARATGRATAARRRRAARVAPFAETAGHRAATTPAGASAEASLGWASLLDASLLMGCPSLREASPGGGHCCTPQIQLPALQTHALHPLEGGGPTHPPSGEASDEAASGPGRTR